MKKKWRLAVFIAVFTVAAAAAQQPGSQPEVSRKQEMAVFALGYYGWNIPQQALASIDGQIQAVFVDLGRFSVIGQSQRFAAADVNLFIDAIVRAKTADFIMPEEFRFGEKAFTEAEFNRLLGAFLVAVPVVNRYAAEFDGNDSKFKCSITTSISFINVAEGTTLGIANVDTSGSSKESLQKAAREAIDAIPAKLSFEIRKIEAFQIKSRILRIDGDEITMQLGRDLGVRIGDEYSILRTETISGLRNELETGLVAIKEVGSEVSKGRLLYSSGGIDENSQLKEIPRFGIEAAPSLAIYRYLPVGGNAWYSGPAKGLSVAFNVRGSMTRGYYAWRPIGGLRIIMNNEQWWPLAVYGGAGFNAYLRRLQLTAYAAVGGTTNVIYQYLNERANKTSDDPFFTHYGIMAGTELTFLATRDMKVGLDVGADLWLSVINAVFSVPRTWNYGGYHIGVTLAIKL